MLENALDLTALKAGDSTAWDAAFPVFWPIALRAAQHPKACLVPWEAEDVAHDAINELIKKIGTVSSLQHAKALVATIAFRSAIALARKKSATKRDQPADYHELIPVETPAHSGTGLTEEERGALLLLLESALKVLDLQTRLLLKEKIGEGRSYQELSHKHGLPMGTVCTKVFQGLKKVRAQLQESPALLKELEEFLR